MSDQLSVLSAVVGLVVTTKLLRDLFVDLCTYGAAGPLVTDDVVQLLDEMHQLSDIFVDVEKILRGAPANKKSSNTGLTMIPPYHLLTVLSNCVLLVSNLHKKLDEIAGLGHPATQLEPLYESYDMALGLLSVKARERIKWELWEKAEACRTIEDLRRHKSGLQLILAIIQCDTAAEAAQSLEKLQTFVEAIAETNAKAAVEPRAIGISVRSQSTLTLKHPTHPEPVTDGLFSPNTYKRIRRFIFGGDSNTPSVLSSRNISLGELLRSEISALEMPICLSDIYHSQLYQQVVIRETQRNPPNLREQSQLRTRIIPCWALGGMLHKAIDTKNYFLLRALITLGADLEETVDCFTPLLLAVKAGDLRACKILIGNGAIINYMTTPNWCGRAMTPLIQAIYSRTDDTKISISALLLDRGANVDLADSAGRTPLSYAAEASNIELCKLLLDRGAMVDFPDYFDRTPLSYTAGSVVEPPLVCTLGTGLIGGGPFRSIGRIYEGIYLDISRLLITRGARADKCNIAGRSPYSYAQDSRNSQICSFFSRVILSSQEVVDLVYETVCRTEPVARCDHEDWHLQTLQLASNIRKCLLGGKHELHKVIRAYNDSGAKTSAVLRTLIFSTDLSGIEEKDSDGYTPLFTAIEVGNLEACRILLERGVVAEGSGPIKLTLLPAAKTQFGDYDLLSGCRAAGDTVSITPLWYALLRCYPGLCKLLVDSSTVATINTPMGSFPRPTPLSFVADRLCNLELCEILIAKGAMVDIPDDSGRTALSYAAAAKLKYECENSKLVCLLLIEKGAKVDIADNSGRTPLSYAAENSLHDICKLLVKAGAAVNSLDVSGRTPLSYAEEKSCKDICELLVENGARVNLPDISDSKLAMAIHPRPIDQTQPGL